MGHCEEAPPVRDQTARSQIHLEAQQNSGLDQPLELNEMQSLV